MDLHSFRTRPLYSDVQWLAVEVHGKLGYHRAQPKQNITRLEQQLHAF